MNGNSGTKRVELIEQIAHLFDWKTMTEVKVVWEDTTEIDIDTLKEIDQSVMETLSPCETYIRTMAGAFSDSSDVDNVMQWIVVPVVDRNAVYRFSQWSKSALTSSRVEKRRIVVGNALRAFYCTDFTGHYPVGTCAVVVAKDIDEARKIVNAELNRQGMLGDATELVEIDMATPHSIIVNDGDY